MSTPSLLDRGFVYAVAHVRGGGEGGRRWWAEGHLDRKRTTFTDFIAAADMLAGEGWAAPDRIVSRGLSAGGLLQGAVFSMAPGRWRAVVAEVPFVDVVTTMLDPSIPLTITEWDEWGDPRDPAMRAYLRLLQPVRQRARRPAAGPAGHREPARPAGADPRAGQVGGPAPGHRHAAPAAGSCSAPSWAPGRTSARRAATTSCATRPRSWPSS